MLPNLTASPAVKFGGLIGTPVGGAAGGGGFGLPSPVFLPYATDAKPSVGHPVDHPQPGLYLMPPPFPPWVHKVALARGPCVFVSGGFKHTSGAAVPSLCLCPGVFHGHANVFAHHMGN